MINTTILNELGRFANLLETDLRRELPRLRASYEGHSFYVVGLYTTPLCEYFAPVGNSEEALSDEQWRWVPGEWSCRLDSLDGMESSNDALASLLESVSEDDEMAFLEGELKDVVFGVLGGLRDEGVFNSFGDPSRLLINVVTPDDDDESWISDAMRLNAEEVWKPMATHLQRADS